MLSRMRRQALVCGAGPSGLAAAIMLHRQGWEDIVLIERRQSGRKFERGKAFNYQLDGRGQAMLSYIGIHEAKIKEYGIENTKFVLNSFAPDGTEKSFAVPFVLPGKKPAYWITRSALLDMLYQRLMQINTDGRITLKYYHNIEGVHSAHDYGVAVISGANNETELYHADLVLGCDGVNSKLRQSMARLPGVNLKDFEPVITPSPSSDLMYKVVKLPREISVSGQSAVVDDHKKSYVFTSIHKAYNRRLSLFSLPVPRPDQERSANIILPKSHDFWRIESPDELANFLKISFPQLDIDNVFPRHEIDQLFAIKPGKFPHPQYSPRVAAQLKTGKARTNFVILGDAAHAFPPDLGLGLNSALEDVRLLGEELETADNIATALSRYEETRLPDSRALVRMVKTVFPYQYNQVPWRLKLSLAKFFMQIGISKISFGLVDQPAFRLTQDHRPSFSEIEKRTKRADLVFYITLVLILAGIIYLIAKIFN